jgi:carboxypeptidase C (cathepsin A)
MIIVLYCFSLVVYIYIYAYYYLQVLVNLYFVFFNPFIFVSFLVNAQYTPAALADQIHNLPGLSVQPTFNQFSGYLTVDVPSNRSIFYWYTESQNKPLTDPVVWWSNGGPGCSGLLGFFTEHGPFRVAPGGGLEPFPFAWNTIANTLYVEAPAGVGFSFSNNPQDYTVGDWRTAQDNYLTIQQFLIRFPHLQNNDFFISAESYGGRGREKKEKNIKYRKKNKQKNTICVILYFNFCSHLCLDFSFFFLIYLGHYVPTLAQAILRNNADPSTPPPLVSNFKGFFLGNPYTDPNENANQGQAGTIW